jgi:hypothetical protein
MISDFDFQEDKIQCDNCLHKYYPDDIRNYPDNLKTGPEDRYICKYCLVEDEEE